jgi:hypothetical protein
MGHAASLTPPASVRAAPGRAVAPPQHLSVRAGGAAGVGVVFWVSLALFPALTVRIPSTAPDPQGWMPVAPLPAPLAPPPSPPPRTEWTRRVPHPVLIGHVAPLPAPLATIRTASPRASPRREAPTAARRPRQVGLISLFNVGDLGGRLAAGRAPGLLGAAQLAGLCAARLGFVPLLVHLQRPGSLGAAHDAAAAAAVLAMAATSGYAASALLVRGQLRVRAGEPREVASTLLSFAMTTGLALGAVSAVPLGRL